MGCEDARALYGEPDEIDCDGAAEKWTYGFVRSDLKAVSYVPVVSTFYRGTNDKIRKLKIYFDDKGVFDRYACSDAKGETRCGLLGG